MLLAATTGCGAGLPQGAPVLDPDLTSLLRPSAPIDSERLVRLDDGTGYYLAELRARPGSGFVERYLDVLDERGVAIAPHLDGGSHSLTRDVLGYRFRAVQEVAVQPYTIRYRLAWDGRERRERGDHPNPIRLAGRWVTVRLPEPFLRAWTEAVLVPLDSPIAAPFAFPFPSDAILVESRETFDSWPSGTEMIRGTLPSQVTFGFLSRSAPAEVIGFYRQALAPFSSQLVTTGEAPGEPPSAVAKVASRPAWAPRDVKWIQIDEDDALLHVPDGFKVSTASHAMFPPRRDHVEGQIKSLRNVPAGVWRYRTSLTFADAAIDAPAVRAPGGRGQPVK